MITRKGTKMNEFKILSIDELDEEFVTKLRVPAKAPQVDNLIPDFVEPENNLLSNDLKDDLTEKTAKNFNIIDEYLASDPKPVSYSTPDSTERTTPRPIVPLGQGKSFYSPVDSNNDEESNILDEDFFEPTNEKNKAKSSGKLIAAKIACIVMLTLTILVFIVGCFISIFLNNNGVDLKGICFNTLASDVELSNDSLKKGDLIISKKLDFEGYSSSVNSPIAIPVEGVDNVGCEVEYIYSVTKLIDDEANIVTYDPETKEISSVKYVGDLTYGVVTYSIPLLGGIIAFALNNAILICVLFVLLAAFWCLLMILIEKNAKKAKTE